MYNNYKTLVREQKKMKIYDNVLDMIGNTPMVRLRTGIPDNGLLACVKLEYFNPTGSLKDRMSYHIIRRAMAEGKIKEGDTIIDNSSGNTGSAMAMVALQFGLKAVVTTPVKTSKEKIDLMRSFGAEVIVTPEVENHDDPEGFFAVARRLAMEKGYFDLDQYDSQVNVEAHYSTTGPEIWRDTEGKITHFVAGIGTGGTFSGVARYLKEMNPNVKTIAVDPEGSVFTDFIREGKEVHGHSYKIEGIGSDVITKAMHKDMVDEVITVPDKDAFLRARDITINEGLSIGGSSGAVAVAMEQVSAYLGKDDMMVGVFADAGIRYLSKCFNDDWMSKQGYLE